MASATHELILRLIGDDKSLNDMYRRQSRGAKAFSQEIKTATDTAGGAFDDLTIKSRRAGSIGLFRFGASGALGLGAGLVVGAQAARELAGALEVTGAAAATTEGKFRNFGSAILSGNVIGAFKALQAEYVLTDEEAARAAAGMTDVGDQAKLSAARAGAAAAGFDSLAASLRKVQEAAIALSVQRALENAPGDIVVPGEQTGPGFKGQPVVGGFKQLPELFSGLSQASREALLDAQIAATEATDAAVLAALRAQEKELRALLKTNLTPKERLDVKTALAGVTGAIDGINDAVKAAADAAAAEAKAAAEAAKEAARRAAAEARERARRAAIARAAARNARQFTALGLTKEGEERAPGVRTLKAQLGAVESAVEGTFLDTKKTKQLLDGVRKVLSGQLGVIGREMKLKIRELLQSLQDELDAAGRGPLTKTKSLNVNELINGIGLARDEERALRARLSGSNSAGISIATSGGTAGAFGVPVSAATGPTVVSTTVNLDGQVVAQNTTIHQQRKDKRNPQQTRGRN